MQAAVFRVATNVHLLPPHCRTQPWQEVHPTLDLIVEASQITFAMEEHHQ